MVPIILGSLWNVKVSVTIGLERRLRDLTAGVSLCKVYINQTLPMLENIVEYYRRADGKTKKKILGFIFSKKLVFENGRVVTFEFVRLPFQYIHKYLSYEWHCFDKAS